jgi:Zn-dependent protease
LREDFLRGTLFLGGAFFFAVIFCNAALGRTTFFDLVCFFFLFFLPGMQGVYHCRPRSFYARRGEREAPGERDLQTELTTSTLLPLGKTKEPNSVPDLTPNVLVFGFIWYVAFLFSTTCHEAAHALVSQLGGDKTAALGGQVSLNPVPHIQREPWGMVVIPILSYLAMHTMFGWASAPYDPLWERRHPKRAALMALAGPGANFSLMLLAVAGLHIGAQAGWFHRDPVTHHLDFAATTLLIFFSLNLLLGTFNLLPVSPLDGSTAVMLFMGERTAQRYLDWLRGNSFALAGLLVGILLFRYIYDPINDFLSLLLLPSHI